MKNHIEQKISRLSQDLKKLKKIEKDVGKKIIVKLDELLKYHKLLDRNTIKKEETKKFKCSKCREDFHWYPDKPYGSGKRCPDCIDIKINRK